MKRLLEQLELSPEEEKLASLFRAAASYEADPFRKRRVLVSLSRKQSAGIRRWWLRPAALVVLFISGSAAAAIGHHYVAQGRSLFESDAPALTRNPALANRSSRSALPSALATSAPSASDTASAAPEPSPSGAGERGDTPPPVPKDAPARRTSRTSEDASHVAEAIQALRADKDPSRAQELLTDYLKAHPNGLLSEDALALSIEAASAQRDPRAVEYSKRYLAKFPQGRYRSLAKRAIERSAH